MASNEIVSEEAEEREFVTNPKNQYVAAGIVSGLASLSIGTRTTTTKKTELWSFKLRGYLFCTGIPRFEEKNLTKFKWSEKTTNI